MLTTGNGQEAIAESLPNFEVISFGYVAEQSRMAEIYRLADIFLFCSLADNHPLAVIESVCSGTRVLGFKTGGIPEIIETEDAGILVDQRDTASLYKALKAIKDKFAIQGRESIRARVSLEKFSAESMFKKYLDLYKCTSTSKAT